MFTDEIRKLLVEVITSWQVIAVTVILILYVFLINYVGRTHHRRYKHPRMPKMKHDTVTEEAPANKEAAGHDELNLEDSEE